LEPGSVWRSCPWPRDARPAPTPLGGYPIWNNENQYGVTRRSRSPRGRSRSRSRARVISCIHRFRPESRLDIRRVAFRSGRDTATVTLARHFSGTMKLKERNLIGCLRMWARMGFRLALKAVNEAGQFSRRFSAQRESSNRWPQDHLTSYFAIRRAKEFRPRATLWRSWNRCSRSRKKSS